MPQNMANAQQTNSAVVSNNDQAAYQVLDLNADHELITNATIP